MPGPLRVDDLDLGHIVNDVAWLAVENVNSSLAPNVFQVAYHGKREKKNQKYKKHWLAKLQMTDG